MPNDLLDDDGYPTEETLARIVAWPMRESGALMAFVREVWCYPNYWRESDGERGERIYEISTGGWSGNESLMGALEQNFGFWSMCWYSSRRGGHYEFRVPAMVLGGGPRRRVR